MSGFNQEHFDDVYSEGGGDPWHFWDSDYEQEKYDRTLRVAAERLEKPETVLELGAGNGAFAAKVTEEYPDTQYLGVDIGEEPLQYAQDHVPEADFIQQDMVDFISENDDAYPLVVASECLYYPMFDRSFREFRQFASELGETVDDEGLLISANIVRETGQEPKKNDGPAIDHLVKVLETDADLERLSDETFTETKTAGDKGPRDHTYRILAFGRV